MVVSRGNAPQSPAYQAGALLLSYGTMAVGAGLAPAQVLPSLGFRDRNISILSPNRKWSGWQELHLRPPRSERGRLLLTLHPGKLALAEGVTPSSSVLEAPRSIIELREQLAH
jgi:hypothetical protein